MTTRILTVNGGGRRGVVASTLLAAIDRQLPKTGRGKADPLRWGDLLAGTSVGSIVVCGLAAGFTPNEITALLARFVGAVFEVHHLRRFWRRVSREGLSAPKHDAANLELALREVFGDLRFGDLPVEVLVPAYDLRSRQLRLLVNSHAQAAELPVWEVCKASSSAPTYFGAHVTRLGDWEAVLVDGGVGANNPAALAAAWASRGPVDPQFDGVPSYSIASSIRLVSIGTGQAVQAITAAEAVEMGAIEWAPQVIDVLMDASADAADRSARVLLGANYHPIEVELRRDQMSLDDPNPNHLAGLIETAEFQARASLRDLIRSAAGALDR